MRTLTLAASLWLWLNVHVTGISLPAGFSTTAPITRTAPFTSTKTVTATTNANGCYFPTSSGLCSKDSPCVTQGQSSAACTAAVYKYCNSNNSMACDQFMKNHSTDVPTIPMRTYTTTSSSTSTSTTSTSTSLSSITTSKCYSPL